MELFDTHTHLYLPDFDIDGGGEKAVGRAIDAGVTKMVFPNVDLASIAPLRSLASKFKGNVYTAMGLHPTEVNESWRDTLDETLANLDMDKDVAIGEIGMDLYWDKTFEDEQMQVFEHQIGVAAECGLPIIIHCREALDQALEVLQGAPAVSAVFHSFGGTVADVERIRRTGDYMFGINGIVTFKNSKLREVLPAIGADCLLLETDSPYLAPVPKRGKRNESAFMVYTAACVAEALGMETEAVAEKTTANALRFFRI